MGTIKFNSEKELEDYFEMIEEINHKYINLKDEIEEKKRELEYAEKDFEDFIEDNKENIQFHRTHG